MCRFQQAAVVPGDHRCRTARRQARDVVGDLRDRHLPARRRRAGGDGPLRPRLGRPRDAAAGAGSARIRAALEPLVASARDERATRKVDAIGARVTAPTIALRADDGGDARRAARCSAQFLRGDAHYRASSAAYGDGGNDGARPGARSVSRAPGDRLRLARAARRPTARSTARSAHASSATRSRRRAARWSPSSTT